jgi:RHS repeat-associated protein
VLRLFAGPRGSFRGVAVVAVLALASTVIATIPAEAAAPASFTAPVRPKPVLGTHAAKLKPQATPASSVSVTPPKAQPVTSGTFTVDVPASAVPAPATTKGRGGLSGATVAGSWSAVGTSGIEVAAATPTKAIPVPMATGSIPLLSTGSVTARVLTSRQARALGGTGIAIELSRAQGTAPASPLAVQVPDKVLSDMFGADFSDRIQWVESSAPTASDFTKSKTTTPGATTPVADAVVPSTPNTASASTVLTPMVAANTIILRPMSIPVSTSGTGSFAATPLDPASSWDVSAQTGDFSWSLPLRTPPAAAGPAPQVALNYDSQSVDGETGSTNNQPSTIGDGWSLGGTGYIQRQYVSCSQDTGASGPVTTSGDLCWLTDNATLNLGGHSGTLVKDATTGVWKLQSDDGTRIEHLNSSSPGGGCTNGTYDNDCWRVTTTDGTQYYFGMNQLPGYASGDQATNSAWTVPVYGNDSGEPCHASTFAASVCTQAWRWNLDYIVDTHSNAEAIYYNAETNKYALDGGAAASYVRGGVVSQIQYGITGGNMYATNAASDEVQFGYVANGRCSATSGCTAEPIGSAATTPATPSLYPDVPWDEYCTASTCPGQLSPTFWSDAELSTVTTQALVSGAYSTVDTWTLSHSFPSPGDGTSAALWLTQVAHQGTSSSASEPPTTFAGVTMQNRVWAVDGLAPLDKYRITSITTSLGAVVSVNYSAQQCTPSGAAAIEASPQTNTNRCFPQWWSPSVVPAQAAQEDLFHKYVVTSVISNPETGGANDQSQQTYYDYSAGNPAWRYDNSPFTLASERTWDVYAGYDKVRVTTGDSSSPTTQQTTLYTFYQGLDGDRAAPSGGTKSVFVDGSTTLKDSLWFEGDTREAVTTNGVGGAVLSDTVTTPWVSAATAVPAGSAPSAYMTGDATVLLTEPLSSGGSRTTTTSTTFDPTYGLPTQVQVATSDAGTTCTNTTYASPNTTAWIIGLPSEVAKVGVSCANAPTAIYPAAAVSDARTTYDSASVGSMPTKGDATKVEEVDSYSGTTASTAHWVTKASTTYDALGRALQVTDVLGHTITMAYTPAASGPLTSTVATSTAPFNWTTTDTYDPRWGVETSATDANGLVTTTQYDGLGRRTGVWLPNRSVVTYPTSPSTGYVYTEPGNAANAIETLAIGPASTLPSFTLYDGLGRPVQTQSGAEGGGSVITDTLYNPAGHVSFTDNAYWTTSVNPSASLFVPSSFSSIPSQTVNAYDGMGRPISATLQTLGTVRSATNYSYEGADETDVTPPSGGTPTSTFSNSLGEKTKLVQYLAATVSGTAPKESTTYAYDPQGSMVSMTDPAGNQWSWGFNVLGQQTSATDPDTGVSSATYDDEGDILTTKDARGKVLAYAYDNLDRKTAEYQTSTGPTGSLLDSWAYDSLDKGQLTSSSSYTGSTAGTPGIAYTDTVLGYTALYEPTGDTVTIPTGAPAFGGTSYLSHYAYNLDGSTSITAYPAEGGLAAETLRTGYDAYGNITTVAGTAGVYSQSIYTALGQVAEHDRTGGTNELSTVYGYDPATGATDQIEDFTQASPSNTVLQNSAYTYDLAGNVTKVASTSATLASDTQCFNYDYLQNLTQAWTPADSNCTEAASSSNLGGAAPYWTNYTVDPATGNRLSTIENSATVGGASTTDTYAYPTAGTANPHAVQTVSHVTGGTTTTSSYGYDATGNTTTRPGQTLTYDAEGKITAVTAGISSQSDVYDASGNLLLEKDSTAGTTLFLGSTELHLASGATTASAVRTYAANGIAVAERSTVAGVSGSTETWLGADAQGTVDLQMNATTGTFGVRLQDPFGNARGTSTTTWADGHGFLNATTDALSGLVQLGARMYDAALGRFLSVDPVLKPSDPQQNNGYSYAHNSPVDLSDANGLDPAEYWNPATAPDHPYVPPGQAPPAAGRSPTQQITYEAGRPLGWMYQHAGTLPAWLVNDFGFTQDSKGILRSERNPLQLKGDYTNFYDQVFKVGAPNQPEQFQFQYGQKSYVIWAWVGDYPAIGDGGEVAAYSQDVPLAKAGPWWHSTNGDPNQPTMTETVSDNGVPVASFDPARSQTWVASWNPFDQDPNVTDLKFTAAVTFPSVRMYQAFEDSKAGASPLWSFPAHGTTATLNFTG